MGYEPNPNETTLWENKYRTSDSHPTKTGQLLLTRELLLELCEQQGKGGDFLVNISAWEKVAKNGKPIINIKIEKPHKFDKASPPPPQPHRSGAIVETDRGIAFTEYRQPAIAETPPQPPKPERYLEALKAKIATIENYPQFEELYNKVKSPKSWEVFQTVPAIAIEAAEILSRKKAELVLSTAPVDLSDILSKIDVECDRLGLSVKEHCLVRWNKARSALTEAELLIYLDELRSAKAITKDDDFF